MQQENGGIKVLEKARSILLELAPQAIQPEESSARSATAITDALVDHQDLERDLAHDIAFHLTDWSQEAVFLPALHMAPDRFIPEEVSLGVSTLLAHAPNHLAAAAKLYGLPAQNVFGVGIADDQTGPWSDLREACAAATIAYPASSENALLTGGGMDRLKPLRLFRFQGRQVLDGFAASIPQGTILSCLRSWSVWLDEGSKMQVACHGSDHFVELRKRRWKTRQDRLIFRYPNSAPSTTRFRHARQALDANGIEYRVTLTRKTRRPRAIELELDPYDPHSPQTVLNLAALVFQTTCSTYDLSCHGEVRLDAGEEAIEFSYPDLIAKQLPGFDFGARVGRLVRAFLPSRRQSGD